MSNIKLIKGDCLEKFTLIKDESIDLVLIDPPYNISKAEWDKWKTVGDYVEFMGKVFLECQRVLKNNGSFYFFHNDFEQMAELQHWIKKNTNFIFKQMIIWNKKFKGCSNEGFLQGFNEVEGLRNYQKMAEYCLFYTFQDEENQIYCDNDPLRPIKSYFIKAKKEKGFSISKINEMLGHRQAEHSFYTKKQWSLPTQETYLQLQKILNLPLGFEKIQQWYENLRYTYNNQKINHSVFNIEIAEKIGHITPKPVDLLSYIIKTSSNENDIILDCFMGSSSTGVACLKTNRDFIGIELDNKYFDISVNRINTYIKNNNLENVNVEIIK